MTKKSLIQKQPHSRVSPFEFMRGPMSSFFQEAWPNWAGWPQQEGALSGNFMPTVETSETKNKVKVSVELPGMTDEDVKLTISPEGDVLTLSGEKKFEEESKDEENNFYHFERSYGSFRRNVPLPCAVDLEKVNAKFKNGVLKVTMHKQQADERPEGRQIQIEV
jgi:HSP20 family protein